MWGAAAARSPMSYLRASRASACIRVESFLLVAGRTLWTGRPVGTQQPGHKAAWQPRCLSRTSAASPAAARPHAPIRRRCATVCRNLRRGDTPMHREALTQRARCGATPYFLQAALCGPWQSKECGTTDAHRWGGVRQARSQLEHCNRTRGAVPMRWALSHPCASVCICGSRFLACFLACRTPPQGSPTTTRKSAAHAPGLPTLSGARSFKRRQNPMQQFVAAPRPRIGGRSVWRVARENPMHQTGLPCLWAAARQKRCRRRQNPMHLYRAKTGQLVSRARRLPGGETRRP